MILDTWISEGRCEKVYPTARQTVVDLLLRLPEHRIDGTALPVIGSDDRSTKEENGRQTAKIQAIKSVRKRGMESECR